MVVEQWWEWCCLCNPFYRFRDERDGGLVFSEVALDELVTREDEEDERSYCLSVSSRDDDTFTLPADFDPDAAYYAAFGAMLADQEGGEAEGAVVAEPRVWDGNFEAARAILQAGCDDEIGINRCLALYRAEIVAACGGVACDGTNEARRRELIGEYEVHMNKYGGGGGGGAENTAQVEALLRKARDGNNQRREERVVYYQQALFGTHRWAEKAKVKREYRVFCASLVASAPTK
jgi:hypothetical protein